MIIRNINTNQMHQEDLQKTTRLTAETIPAVKLIIVIFKVFMHGIANSPCSIFIENVFNFFIKLEKLVELVIDTGREFEILGPWWRIKIYVTVLFSYYNWVLDFSLQTNWETSRATIDCDHRLFNFISFSVQYSLPNAKFLLTAHFLHPYNLLFDGNPMYSDH